MFDKIIAFLTLTILRLGFSRGKQDCVINSSQSFQAFDLKLCTDILSILRMCI